MSKPELTQEILQELLDYNPETGVLTWKKRNDKQWSSSFEEAVAARKTAEKLHGYHPNHGRSK